MRLAPCLALALLAGCVEDSPVARRDGTVADAALADAAPTDAARRTPRAWTRRWPTPLAP
ncbi:MAG: hypothetical protein H6706_15630 [Myxococcales bacterium]|nr:hypothetical protein [Myxococcales bacterium]